MVVLEYRLQLSFSTKVINIYFHTGLSCDGLTVAPPPPQMSRKEFSHACEPSLVCCFL
jgi:hypothetical protein